MDTLKINIFGEIQILWNDVDITNNVSSKASIMLCILSISPDQMYSRDKLINYFWDSSNTEAGKYNLRYTLWSMRKVLKLSGKSSDESVIVNIRDKCKINPKVNVVSDVFLVDETFNKLKNEIEHQEEVELIKAKDASKDEFMEGIYLNKCHEFNDWIFFMREKYQRHNIDISNMLADKYVQKSKYLKAIEVLEEMLRLNPFQEDIYVKLMNVYSDMGKRKEALELYEKCSNILRDELNVSPLPSTKKVYEQIIKLGNTTVSDALVKPVISENIINKTSDDLSRIAKKYESSRNVITVKCFPVDNIDYMCLSDILDGIFSIDNFINLEKISGVDMLDLVHINGCAKYYLKEDEKVIKPESFGIEIRMFKALEGLFKIIGEEVVVIIENFEHVDEKSLKYIKYLILRNEKLKDVFIVSEDNEALKI